MVASRRSHFGLPSREPCPPPRREAVKWSRTAHILRVTRLIPARTVGGLTSRAAAAMGARSCVPHVRRTTPGRHRAARL
jgi:hypothetical protein